MEKDLEMARRIAGTAAERGGRVYFVGGFVRDGVMGRESKDVDIEIHGMTADAVRGMLGRKEAERRRDFTMNAMMQDVLTGEIFDDFGGREDIRKRVIRHVDEETFRRDPLRAMRAAQFAARFDFAIAPETMAVCRTLELRGLAKERVMGEVEKALMQSEKPSRFFETLREMGGRRVDAHDAGCGRGGQAERQGGTSARPDAGGAAA